MCIFSKKCPTKEVDIRQPQFDETTYWGRVKEYFFLNNPLFAFASHNFLECCKEIVDLYLIKKLEPPCPTKVELWNAKFLVDACYHPDTGELVEYPARRATRIIFNSLLVGGMLAYYKNMIAIGALQTVNQGFNAFVISCNRTRKQEISDESLYKACGAATIVAVAAAIGLGTVCKKMYDKLYWRSVPFVAVALADCVRVPLLRSCDLNGGVPLVDTRGIPMGWSTSAARKAVGDDILCRIMMAAPPLLLTPLLCNHLERTGTFCRYPWLNFPAHLLMVAFCITFLTPLMKGLFENRGVMWVADVEDDAYCAMKFHPSRLEYERDLPMDQQ
ncbi:sideroflexin-1-like [Onthophagus taurus]|uniref:sideroflexin-1-like n=1 Tax=Onthophagus taurus TaxID=166361 RepID=UPI000C20368A|nr:sideroflexin-1-like [Onthophagus taurus]